MKHVERCRNMYIINPNTIWKKQTRCLAFVLLVVYLWISMAVKFRACGSPLGTQWLDLVSWIHRRRNRWEVHSTSVDPICSMYGLFTYKTGWFLGHMLVNIPCMEHMGTISDDHRNWGENTFFFSHVWIGHRSTCIMKWLLVRSSRNKCGTIEDAQGSCMPEDLVVKSALGHGRLMKGTHDKIGQQTRPKVEWTV